MTSDGLLAYAYSDETRYNVGRYRGVALVSAPQPAVADLNTEVRDILAKSGASECKWEKVRSARMRFLAEKLLEWTLEAALAGRLRVDTLTWDTGDRAYASTGTPYLKKLHQMYRDVLAQAIAHRWPWVTAWTLYPDEQTAVRWSALQAALPRLTRIVPSGSQDEPLIQVADLFAGLAVYSRAGYDTYEQWLCLPASERCSPPKGPLASAVRQLSASDRYRCLLLDDFFMRCKLRLPGVTLRTNRGLRTYDVTKPIVFRWDGI